MSDIRTSIEQDEFPKFVKTFMYNFYKKRIGNKEGGIYLLYLF